MKKLIYILAGIILLTSCKKDFLDRQPLDEYSESSLWSNAKDAQTALNGCYSGWEDADRIVYMDCASDNAYNQWPWEGYTALGNMQLLTPTNTGAGMWDFGTIQRCNWFLANVDVTPMDDNLKARMKAEARFLRAYKYFSAAQVYGDYPLVLKQLTTAEANEVKRTPKTEIMDFVIKELGEIAPNLPTSYSGSDVGRITRGAALALKGRTELFTARFSEAAITYKKVMDLGVYKLFPNYQDLFRIQNEDNSEIVLDVQYKENDYSNGILGVMPSSSYGGWSSINPTQSLVDAYEMKNGKKISDAGSGFDAGNPYKDRDPRLSATIVYPGMFYEGKYFNSIDKSSPDYYAENNNSKTGYSVKKYTSNLSDFSDMWNNGLNMPVIRYAEVLLGYAEAKIEAGQIDATVNKAINDIRSRAGMPVLDQGIYNNQISLRSAVRNERRVELAMEGLRWYDVQRWKIAEQVMNGQVYGALLGKVNAGNGSLTLTPVRIEAEKRTFNPAINYLWPIPQKQIDINHNLNQNAGYN